MHVNLIEPPEKRWLLTVTQKRHALELLNAYKADLGLSNSSTELLPAMARDIVDPLYWIEMESIATQIGEPVESVVISNLYYDVFKSVIGCTAFAVDTPEGPLHARNMDWWTTDGILSRHTTTCHFTGAPAGEFTTIGWPGFVGAFSAIAPGRFAITLNAVLSLEKAVPAMPIVFLIRNTLENAKCFEEAKYLLSETPIPCDCLLLLTGLKAGQLVVIERTPTRHAILDAVNGVISVTNNYQKMLTGNVTPDSELLKTSCSRFKRIQDLVSQRQPISAEACLEHLSDPSVRMTITMQQMVFQASTGKHWLKLPE